MTKVKLFCVLFLAILPLLTLGDDVYYTLPFQYPPTQNTSLDSAIVSLMNKYQIAGLTASVITQGQTIYTNSFGWSNLASQLPYRTDSKIRIASMSKSVTATALMQMYDRGLIKSLDDDITQYLGYRITNVFFPDDIITLRQLMTHTSSLLDDYLDFVVESYSEAGPKLSLRELVLPGGKYYNAKDLFNRYHRPGDPTGFVYSNLNPIIIATIIENLSYKLPGYPNGLRFDVYATKFIFEPLGMYETSFNAMDLVDCAQGKASTEKLASIYNYFRPAGPTRPSTYVANLGLDDSARAISQCTSPIDYSVYKIGTNGALFGPQGGIRTTPRDYAKYQNAHINQGALPGGARILTPASAALMQSVQWKGNSMGGFYKKYGFYLQVTDDLLPGRSLVGHTGDAYGMQGIQFFDPTEKWGIVIFSSGAVRRDIGVFPAHEVELYTLLYRTFIADR